MNAAFELVLDCQCRLAESPVWWAERRSVAVRRHHGPAVALKFKPGSRARGFMRG